MPATTLVELDVGSRRRMPALARDLDRLGVPLPAPVAFPLTSLAGALGALYVSEGATLGGRGHRPPRPGRARSGHAGDVLRVAGVDVVARWATCRRVIDRLLVDTGRTDEAAAVATAVFDRFAEVLCR